MSELAEGCARVVEASTSVSIAVRDTATSKAERNDEGWNDVCMVRPLIMGCHVVCINKLYAAGSLRIRNSALITASATFGHSEKYAKSLNAFFFQ